jgi:hypothetical protein
LRGPRIRLGPAPGPRPGRCDRSVAGRRLPSPLPGRLWGVAAAKSVSSPREAFHRRRRPDQFARRVQWSSAGAARDRGSGPPASPTRSAATCVRFQDP